MVSESECSESLCMTDLPPVPLFLTAGSHWIPGRVDALPHWRAAGGWEHMHLQEKCVHSACLWKTKTAVFQQETYFLPFCAEQKLPLSSSLHQDCCMLSKLPLQPIGYVRDGLKSLCCREKHTAGMFWHKDESRRGNGSVSWIYITLFFAHSPL